MAQLPQAVDEALAALAVDPAGLQHDLALLHQLPRAIHTHSQEVELLRSGSQLEAAQMTNCRLESSQAFKL